MLSLEATLRRRPFDPPAPRPLTMRQSRHCVGFGRCSRRAYRPPTLPSPPRRQPTTTITFSRCAPMPISICISLMASRPSPHVTDKRQRHSPTSSCAGFRSRACAVSPPCAAILHLWLPFPMAGCASFQAMHPCQRRPPGTNCWRASRRTTGPTAWITPRCCVLRSICWQRDRTRHRRSVKPSLWAGHCPSGAKPYWQGPPARSTARWNH